MRNRREPPALGWTSGFSLIEVMVATTLLALVMAAAYSNLMNQMRVHAAQRLVTETMNDARSAVRMMMEQLEMAGFGVPVATSPSIAPKLVTATPTEVSFWTKVNATHTFLTAAVAPGSTGLDVLSADGISRGMSIYVSDPRKWSFGTVQSVSGTRISVSPALSAEFNAGSLVTPVEQVTFTWRNHQLLRNGRRYIANVPQLTFGYDARSLDAIRQVDVVLTVQARTSDPKTGRPYQQTMTGHAVPPNLAL
jgi:prepilin-type N-terminal cleavage/methylation domain-containing protein